MLVGTGQDALKIAGEMLDAFGSVDNITYQLPSEE